MKKKYLDYKEEIIKGRWRDGDISHGEIEFYLNDAKYIYVGGIKNLNKHGTNTIVYSNFIDEQNFASMLATLWQYLGRKKKTFFLEKHLSNCL